VRAKQEKAKGGKSYRQADLAKHVGIPRPRISMIENGHILPTSTELEKIAEYLEVTPGHLYSRTLLMAIQELEGSRGRQQ